MSARGYVLAHIDATPDPVFPSLRAMAAYLAGWRNTQPPGDDGEPQSFLLRGAQLWGRESGLQGACIAVRIIAAMDQARDAGPGRLVGYAFLPEYPYVTAQAVRTLMTAIGLEADAIAARAAAQPQRVAA